jgi:hypothetical protein
MIAGATPGAIFDIEDKRRRVSFTSVPPATPNARP